MSTSSQLLVLGDVTYLELPPVLTEHIKRVVYPLLAHSQLSVREAGIQLFGTFAARSTVDCASDAIDDVLAFLRVQVPVRGSAASASCADTAQTLDAFAAEGVLGLLGECNITV